MAEPGDTVLCALSGGADSVSLLLCLQELGLSVCACHLNHCLRGAQSDADEAFCRALCERKKIPFRAQRRDAAQAARRSGQSIETAARVLRYRFFEQCAEEFSADRIATAHTADDNLETMLFRLIRGTGAAGLAGIPPVRGKIIRPLFRVERRDVERYLTARGQNWCIDATNDEDGCTRNQIRHQVIPALRAIAPEAARHAAETALLLRQDDAALCQLAEQAQDTCALSWLNEQPAAIRSRAIRAALRAAGVPEGETNAGHIRAAEQLCAGRTGGVSLPGGFRAARRGGRLCVLPPVRRVEPTELRLDQPVLFGEYVVSLTKNAEHSVDFRHTIPLSYDIIAMAPLYLRNWNAHDRMMLPDARGERTLKRLYADRGILPAQRDGLPVLCSGTGELLAAAGIGAARSAVPNNVADTLWLRIEKKGL